MSANRADKSLQTDTELTQTQGNEAPTWLVAMAKAGYGARGLLYVIIGGLAFLKAINQGGDSTDSSGAIEQVLQAPGGVAILWVVAASLIGYSVWRFAQAVLDADEHGTDGKGLIIRAALFTSSLTHLLLAYTAVKMALQISSSSGGDSKEGLVATILGWPGGPWIVGLIGCCIAGAGIAHFIKAIKERYKEHFAVDPAVMKMLDPICKLGLAARGFSFLIIAGMFIFAASTQDPDKAGGLKDVFSTLSEQAFGPYLLGALAVGLLSFGLYSAIEAMYRKISYK